MTHYINVIQSALATIRVLLSGGIVETSNAEVRKMIKEVYDIEVVPHTREDRSNLKKDRDAAIKDYKKAIEDKKLELYF